MRRPHPTFFRPRLEQLEDRLTMSGPGANNPGVLPPQSHPNGATYGEWAARWWQWAYKQPVDTNPLFDETGAKVANGQSGNVWFLAGVINVSGTAERTATIPTGKALFFPIVNFEADNLAPPTNPPLDVAGLRALAKSVIDGATDLAAEVDGRAVVNLPAYREQSPVFSITLPDNNLFQFFGFNVPAGTYSLPDGFVDDGYYLMLAPLSAGPHTIHFHASIPSFDFTLDITYHLTVAGGAGAGGKALPATAGAASMGGVDVAGVTASLALAQAASGQSLVGAPSPPANANSAPALSAAPGIPEPPAAPLVIGTPAWLRAAHPGAVDGVFATFPGEPFA